MRLLTALLFLPLFWFSGLAPAAEGDPLPVPELHAPVTDLAQLLSPADAQALNARLLAFSQEKGSQVAVLIVPTTAPEDIFSYSFRVADAWKLGRKGIDDGVLLVIAVKDRTTHLQVGYGLEGPIPDARAKQILQDIIRPRFQQGDFAGGINAGVDAVIKLINGEGLPAPTASSTRKKNDNPLVLALMAGVFAGLFARGIFGRLPGSLAGGGVGFAVAMVLGLAMGAAVGVAVVAGVFALVASASGRGGFLPGGGFGGGGFGGGGFGGGGGGFGGGGGGFGGGGASGNW